MRFPGQISCKLIFGQFEISLKSDFEENRWTTCFLFSFINRCPTRPWTDAAITLLDICSFWDHATRVQHFFPLYFHRLKTALTRDKKRYTLRSFCHVLPSQTRKTHQRNFPNMGKNNRRARVSNLSLGTTCPLEQLNTKWLPRHTVWALCLMNQWSLPDTCTRKVKLLKDSRLRTSAERGVVSIGRYLSQNSRQNWLTDQRVLSSEDDS